MRCFTHAVVVAVAVAVAGCGGDDETTSGGDGKAGGPLGEPVAAQIVDRPHGFVGSDVLRPLKNGWRAGSTTRYTEVNAGALARKPETGALAIFRSDYENVTQDIELVEVEGSGPIRITKAPTGEGTAESAQKDGKIEFEGKRGVTGTLDLSDDEVTLDGS